MDQGGNYWTLFTPGIWKVLHAVLEPKRRGGIRLGPDVVAGQSDMLPTEGAFSQRDTVGCEQRSVPLSGKRPQASLKPGSLRR